MYSFIVVSNFLQKKIIDMPKMLYVVNALLTLCRRETWIEQMLKAGNCNLNFVIIILKTYNTILNSNFILVYSRNVYHYIKQKWLFKLSDDNLEFLNLKKTPNGATLPSVTKNSVLTAFKLWWIKENPPKNASSLKTTPNLRYFCKTYTWKKPMFGKNRKYPIKWYHLHKDIWI